MRRLVNPLVLGLAASWAVAALSATPPAASKPAPMAGLTVEQIVERHFVARGSVAGWRAVQSLSFTGKMEAGGKQNSTLPFVMELKRPHKMRVEIEFAHDRAVQVYDGTDGYKLRPFLGRKEVERYTAEQLKSASIDAELDGYLVDYASKGTKVALDGTEKVEGRDTYRLKLTLKGGEVRRLWIDAATFLEAKIDGAPRRLDGKMRPVEIYYRDFHLVDGLEIPFVLETAIVGYKQTHKIVIEKAEVNPRVDDARFTRADLDAAADSWRNSAHSSSPRPGPGSAVKPPARS